jgi:hypothetical protein
MDKCCLPGFIFLNVATPLWDKCEGEAHTPKSGKLESSRTPENSELDFRGQISSHSSVLHVIGKVLKCRCPKWPRMRHLDIFSPSYGQKKSRKSNCQFDSRPLKVGNPSLPEAMALESSWGKLQLWFRPRSNRRSKPGDMSSQSPENPTRDSFGTPPWESQEKVPFGCSLGEELQRILYGGRWWLPPSPSRGESSVSKCPWLVPRPKGGLECELTFLWLVFGCRFEWDNTCPSS